MPFSRKLLAIIQKLIIIQGIFNKKMIFTDVK